MHDEESKAESSWTRSGRTPSLEESFQTVPVPHNWPRWRKMLAFAGPGYLVAVGYIDPGNWATDLAGGSQFGYSLLWIILLSNVMAMLLQMLSGKLGIVTGRDLAQACRDHYSLKTTYVLWVLCEIAICACDLAEVIGSAVALNLLFDLPLLWGVLLTVFDVLIIIYLLKFSFRYLEGFVLLLIIFIGLCFGLEIAWSHPNLREIFEGFAPQKETFMNPEMLYIAIGIIGATVMPHNLYLHSSIVQTRKYKQDLASKGEAIQYVTADSTIALIFAFLINAGILILSASAFHANHYQEVAEIQDAYKLLTPILNSPIASTLFALSLLAAGQNSTLTGTLAGQIVMEGFLDFRLRPWVRRLITRGLAITPTVVCIILFGEASTARLLIFSQVILSFQLAFAVIPLILFTNDSKKMGPFANSKLTQFFAWTVAFLIVTFNLKYIYDFVKSVL